MPFKNPKQPKGELKKCINEKCNNYFQPTVTNYKTKKYCSRSCTRKGKPSWSKGIKNTWYNPKGLEKGRGWNKGIAPSEKTKEKLRKLNLGKKHSKETKKKLSKMFSGKNHYNWKGGITALNMIIRRCFEYRQWRSDVFMRDIFTCVVCGDNKGGNLNADHYPIPFSVILKKNNINSLEEACKCERLWDINNGRTLCEDCHKKTETYGNKIKLWKKE